MVQNPNCQMKDCDMGWLIIGILAAIYLIFRLVQMTSFVVSHFFLNPNVPSPAKVAAFVLLPVLIWGMRRWWKWYFKKQDAPKKAQP